MKARCLACLILWTFGSVLWAATFTVVKVSDTGTGSLRWAIQQANANAGADTIRFSPTLAGKTIAPASALPALTDNQTTINGDINGDGKPDILLNGKFQGSGSGLWLDGADFCTIRGLAIGNMPGRGIALSAADSCVIRSCHLGCSPNGLGALPNGDSDLGLYAAHYNDIGGPLPAHRNIISAAGGVGHMGIEVSRAVGTEIMGNYVGVRADGMSVFGANDIGIALIGLISGGQTFDTMVGGATAGRRNLIGGVQTGVYLTLADGNVVRGNYIGLGADGNKPLPIGDACVFIDTGCAGNWVGGTTTGTPNYFAGGWLARGVVIQGTDTYQNKVQGNYFGFNAGVTAQRPLDVGIEIHSGAGNQLIGGSVAAVNYIAPNGGDSNTAIMMSAGAGTLIRNNRIGVYPTNKLTKQLIVGIELSGVAPTINENLIAHCEHGISAAGTAAQPKVNLNTFRACDIGVTIYNNARCWLGNLQNPSTADDGGNRFRVITKWFVYNSTTNYIRCEGNSFGTTSKAAIDAQIYDKLDVPSLGRVDFDPLLGGVSPSSLADGAFCLSAAAAIPTAAGAQVTFTLSSAAQVDARVMNLAGRPVKTLCQGHECEAGANTLLWNGHSDHGLSVPSGTYLVEINARADNGQQARALTQVRLGP